MKKEYLKIYLVAAVIILLFSRLGLTAEYSDQKDPENDRVVSSWNGYIIPPEFNYYFYKEGVTKDNQQNDFLGCILNGMVEGITLSVYDGGMGSKNGWDPIYTTWKIFQRIGICMEDKGYVIKEHKVNNYNKPQKILQFKGNIEDEDR